jgi:hypothetical protein
LDDYASDPRRNFPWNPPLKISLRARVSTKDIPGTWGFGLWNDPFSLSFGFGGGTRRLPALPNAAWFFFASPPNYLSLRDDLPAQGALAGTFHSPYIPAPILALGLPFIPLLVWPWAARQLRPLGRRLIRQDTTAIRTNVSIWHTYTLVWQAEQVSFQVDQERVFETTVSPRGSMGLVLWIDNQYAAFPPDGCLAYGTLPNPEPVWLEIGELGVEVEG